MRSLELKNKITPTSLHTGAPFIDNKGTKVEIKKTKWGLKYKISNLLVELCRVQLKI